MAVRSSGDKLTAGDTGELDQNLHTAFHYTVGRICDTVAAERNVSFDRRVVAALSYAALAQLDVMSRDLRLFARHARRATIAADDVKLLVRRAPKLCRIVERQARDLHALQRPRVSAAVNGKASVGKKRKRSLASPEKSTAELRPAASVVRLNVDSNSDSVKLVDNGSAVITTDQQVRSASEMDDNDEPLFDFLDLG